MLLYNMKLYLGLDLFTENLCAFAYTNNSENGLDLPCDYKNNH